MPLELEWTYVILTLFKQYVFQARPGVAFQLQGTAVGAVQPQWTTTSLANIALTHWVTCRGGQRANWCIIRADIPLGCLYLWHWSSGSAGSVGFLGDWDWLELMAVKHLRLEPPASSLLEPWTRKSWWPDLNVISIISPLLSKAVTVFFFSSFFNDLMSFSHICNIAPLSYWNDVRADYFPHPLLTFTPVP